MHHMHVNTCSLQAHAHNINTSLSFRVVCGVSQCSDPCPLCAENRCFLDAPRRDWDIVGGTAVLDINSACFTVSQFDLNVYMRLFIWHLKRVWLQTRNYLL